MLNSRSDKSRPAALVAATVSAAKAELELDRPVLLGKLFADSTTARSEIPASERTLSKWETTLATAD